MLLQHHRLRGINIGIRLQLAHDFLAGDRVEVEHGERAAAFFGPAERHAGDVHVMLAEERADVADDAGTVVILYSFTLPQKLKSGG